MQNIPFIEDLMKKFGAGNAVVEGGNASMLPSLTSPAPTNYLDSLPRLASNSQPSGFMETDEHKRQMQDIYNGLSPLAQAITGSPNAPTLPPIIPEDNSPRVIDRAPAIDAGGLGQPPAIGQPVDTSTPPPAIQRPTDYIRNPQPVPSITQTTVTPAPTETPDTTGVPGIATQSPEDRYAGLEYKQSQYGKGLWRKFDDKGNVIATTSNPNEAAKDPSWKMAVAPGSARNKKWSIWEKIGSALAGWAQGGIGGAIAAGTNRNYFSQLKDRMEMQRLLPQIQARQQIEQRQAQTAKIYADNARQAAQVEAQTKAKTQELKDKRRTAFFKAYPAFDPTRATPAQKAWLAEFDETPESVGKYDIANPRTKQIGDTLYQYDRTTNTWMDSGIKDSNKKLVEVTGVDPATNKTYTFMTSADKAASMMNQRTVAGLQIAAQKDRQLTQQEWQGIQNDKNREIARANLAQRVTEFEQAKRDKDQAKMDALKLQIADFELKLNNPNYAGLSPEDKQALLDELPDELK